MRFKNFYTLLNEAKLSPKDLEKPGKNVAVRGITLISKLNKKEPFEMMDGSMKQLRVSPTDLKKLQVMARKQDFSGIVKNVKITDTSGEVVPLSKIKKTAEFGSSAGSGGGAAATALFESAACMVTAWMLSNKIKSEETAMKKLSAMTSSKMTAAINRSAKYFNCDQPVDKVVDYMIANKKWLVSSVRTGATIIKELKPKATHSFHRGSQLMNAVYAKAQKLLREAGFKIGHDKWNPGDIWMFDESSPMITKIMNANNISDYNALLAKQYKAKKKAVIGISLKLVGPKGDVPVKYYNLGSAKKEKMIGIDEINPKVLGRVPLAKDVVIIDNDPVIKMAVRDFANRIASPVTGELAGKMAAGGKVGNQVMVSWLNKNVRGAKIRVYGKTDIIKGKSINDNFVMDMMKIINQLKKKRSVDTTKLKKIKTSKDLKNIIKEMRKKDKNLLNIAAALSSKIQAFQIALYANDDFFDYVNAYASSSIKGVSGPFVKIGK